MSREDRIAELAVYTRFIAAIGIAFYVLAALTFVVGVVGLVNELGGDTALQQRWGAVAAGALVWIAVGALLRLVAKFVYVWAWELVE